MSQHTIRATTARDNRLFGIEGTTTTPMDYETGQKMTNQNVRGILASAEELVPCDATFDPLLHLTCKGWALLWFKALPVYDVCATKSVMSVSEQK